MDYVTHLKCNRLEGGYSPIGDNSLEDYQLSSIVVNYHSMQHNVILLLLLV